MKTRNIFKEIIKAAMFSDTLIAKKVLKPICIDIICTIEFRHWMEDERYIRWLYKKRFGLYPDLKNPKNFNEKNNWRKLHDRQDRYTDMVDKYKLKSVVEKTCGAGYTIPLLGAWDKPQDIDFSTLPEKFVLKANHAGVVIVCRDKASFNEKEAVEELRLLQRRNYYKGSREWPYKNVCRRILCEQYMGENLTDYKNYCFNGKMAYTLVWDNRSREDGRKPTAYYCGSYDRDWQKTDMKIDYPSMDTNHEKPVCYDEMVRIAEKLSAGIPFVRVDCFIIDGHVYVGEMTFFPWGGFQKFIGEKWNLKLGEMEKLPGVDVLE